MKKVLFSLVLTVTFGSALLAQNGHMGHRIQKNLIFPHFVLASGFTTEIILMNPAPGDPVSGTLFFFNQDGTPLTVQSEGNAVSQIALTIPAEGIRFVTASGTSDDVTVGWALFDAASDDPSSAGDNRRDRLSGSLVYTRVTGGQTTAKVGVVTARYETGGQRRLAIPVISSGTVNTGVAVVNAGQAALNLTFQLQDAAGAIVQNNANPAQPVSPLAPGTQRAIFVTELFPDFNLSNFRGTLSVLADGEGLVALGLLTDQDALSSIPVVRVPSAQQGPMTFTVANQGFTFSPATLTVRSGDTVTWALDNIHNVVEVTQATHTANGSTPKAGGFSLPFGGGSFTFTTPGTYFYVCSPHAAQGMKGTITVNP